MTDQEMALRRLQQLAFALQETVLFLDGHPQNTAALRYYQKTMSEYETQMREYETKYGPVSVLTPGTNGTMGGRDWLWSTTPWPWEMGFPATGDGDRTPTSPSESANEMVEE